MEVSAIDAQGRGEKGIKVDPPPKTFTKLVNTNAIKPQKGAALTPKF